MIKTSTVRIEIHGEKVIERGAHFRIDMTDLFGNPDIIAVNRVIMSITEKDCVKITCTKDHAIVEFRGYKKIIHIDSSRKLMNSTIAHVLLAAYNEEPVTVQGRQTLYGPPCPACDDSLHGVMDAEGTCITCGHHDEKYAIQFDTLEER